MGSLRNIKLALFACLYTVAALVCCSQQSRQPQTLAEFEKATAGKTPKQIAQLVFDNYNCKACHTLGQKGKFGFTRRGRQVKERSEGCIPLLAAMNAIAQIPESERSFEQRQKAARFQEYGCAFCHQVKPGQLGLTEIGRKLAFLHLPCSGVQQVLTE